MLVLARQRTLAQPAVDEARALFERLVSLTLIVAARVIAEAEVPAPHG